jgi:hypothetical protein
MKHAAVLACVATVLILPAELASGGASRPSLLGIAVERGSNHLVRLDPLTLRLAGSRSLELGAFATWDESPSGSRLVFARHTGTLRFVDPQRLRFVGTVRLPGFIDPETAWVAPRTLLVLDTVSVAAVDPVSLRVRWRRALPRALMPLFFEREARSPSGLVFLLPPIDGSVGQTTLVSIDLSGQVRSVDLTQIQSGAEQDPSGASLFSGSAPGLAVDPETKTAYVIGGDDTVAAVDLTTLAVSYHDRPRTLAHAEKVLSGPTRQAVWLGNGLIAVTGENDRAWLDANHTYQETVTPAGLTIIDTRTWTARPVDPGASSVTFAGGLLLATGESWDTTAGISDSKPKGEGLSAYGLDGTLVFHLLGQVPVQQVRAANGLAYAWQPAEPQGADHHHGLRRRLGPAPAHDQHNGAVGARAADRVLTDELGRDPEQRGLRWRVMH